MKWTRHYAARLGPRDAALNEIAVEALSRGAGVGAVPAKNHDLDFAIGTWVADANVERALDLQRQIDPDLWK